jgi:hypothetical protein
MSLRPLGTLGIVLALACAAACGDPVHEAEVNALGPEAPGVPHGPTHRPGQPCLTCHGGEGPGDPTFVTAGTIYVNAYAAGVPNVPLVGGTVHLIDANGSTFDSTTNIVGTFYVTTDQWSPTFPLGARSADAGTPADGCVPVGSDASEYAGEISVAPPAIAACKGSPTAMTSTMGRGGVYASCAYCHFDPPGPRSPGHVYQN